MQIVEVQAVDNLVDTKLGSLRLAHREQVVLAQVASVERIRSVAGNLELVGLDEQMARADQSRHRERGVAILVGHRGRGRRQREH